MKTKRVLVSLALGLSCSSAMAYTSVTCSKDNRPVDGNLTEVTFTQLVQPGGSGGNDYQVKRRIVTAGMIGYVDDNTRSILSIECHPLSSRRAFSCNSSRFLAEIEAVELNASEWKQIVKFNFDGSTETYEFADADCQFVD